MGILVTRTHKEQYKNEVYDWYIGNTMDPKESVYSFSIDPKIETSQTQMLLITDNSLTFTDGSNWNERGVDVGTVLNLISSGTQGNGTFSVNSNLTVLTVQGDTITFSGTPLSVFETTTVPGNNGDQVVEDFTLNFSINAESILFKFNLIENDTVQSPNFESFIDGTETTFQFLDVHTATFGVPIDAEFLGYKSGSAIYTAQLIKKSVINGIYSYDLIIKHWVHNLFDDESNFEDLVAPDHSINNKSVTDVILVEARPEYNNPNAFIRNMPKDMQRLGNTGWIEENYNGLDNDFNSFGISYFDSIGNPIPYAPYNEESSFMFSLEGDIDPVIATTQFAFSYFLVPSNEDLWKNNDDGFHRNIRLNNGGNDEFFKTFLCSAGPEVNTSEGFTLEGQMDRMDIHDISFIKLFGNVVVSGKMKPTPEFSNYVESLPEDQRKFAVLISIGKDVPGQEMNFQNRVQKLCIFDNHKKHIPIAGEYENIEFNFYEHHQTSDTDGSSPCTEIVHCIENDYLVQMPFTIDSDPNIVFEKMEFGFLLQLPNGLKYDIDKHSVNLSNYPIDGNNVQQINFNSSRGFKLPLGNEKNFFKIERNLSTDSASDHGYKAFFGYKLRWEDWILNNNVPNQLIDVNLPNNGLNNRWSVLSSSSNLYYFTRIYKRENGELVLHENKILIQITDYNKNPNINQTIEFKRSSDLSLLNNTIISGFVNSAVLDNENTQIEVQFSPTTGTLLLDDYFMVVSVEKTNGSGQNVYYQITTEYDTENSNPLRPVQAETRLKAVQNGTGILVTCEVQPDLLPSSLNYKFSAYIQKR